MLNRNCNIGQKYWVLGCINLTIVYLPKPCSFPNLKHSIIAVHRYKRKYDFKHFGNELNNILSLNVVQEFVELSNVSIRVR